MSGNLYLKVRLRRDPLYSLSIVLHCIHQGISRFCQHLFGWRIISFMRCLDKLLAALTGAWQNELKLGFYPMRCVRHLIFQLVKSRVTHLTMQMTGICPREQPSCPVPSPFPVPFPRPPVRFPLRLPFWLCISISTQSAGMQSKYICTYIDDIDSATPTRPFAQSTLKCIIRLHWHTHEITI